MTFKQRIIADVYDYFNALVDEGEIARDYDAIAFTIPDEEVLAVLVEGFKKKIAVPLPLHPRVMDGRYPRFIMDRTETLVALPDSYMRKMPRYAGLKKDKPIEFARTE